ncbi:MAG TPA: YtxH domain-containing protein [Nitrospira sp.]|nr:YtxH domain-containing protein [Nitrospira sp.]
MNNDHGKYSGTALFLTFLGGAVVGAIAGILLTDRSGQETRWELEDYAKRKQKVLIKKAKEVRAALDDVIERGKVFITEKRAGTEASVTTGKEALKEAIENRPRAV